MPYLAFYVRQHPTVLGDEPCITLHAVTLILKTRHPLSLSSVPDSTASQTMDPQISFFQ